MTLYSALSREQKCYSRIKPGTSSSRLRKVCEAHSANCLAQWCVSVILTTLEAEIGRTAVPGQPGQKVCKNPSQLKNAGHGVNTPDIQLQQEA
jgi:hypothetical protein